MYLVPDQYLPTMPGSVRAAQVLLWFQFGLGPLGCFFMSLVLYVITSGAYHAGDPRWYTSGIRVGSLVFAVVVLASMIQFPIIAILMETARSGIWHWALLAAALPILVLAVFAIANLIAARPYQSEGWFSLVVVAFFHVPGSIAIEVCLLTRASRRWFGLMALGCPAASGGCTVEPATEEGF